MHSSFLKRLLVPLALMPFATADYYIDDQNYTSLIYSNSPSGAKWGPFQENGETLSVTLTNGTIMTVNASQCFNYTYTYAACTVADNCQVQIPFTGSGIAIHVLQAGAQGINASLIIDRGVPSYNALPAPPGPDFYIPNVTLFDIQGMATGNHTATMTVRNWDRRFSGMMFDYALINQTIVTSTTSSVTSPSSSSPSTVSAPPSSVSTVNIGAIVGGAVGGAAGLLAIVLVIFYLRRRRRYQPQMLSANLDAEPKMQPSFPLDNLPVIPDPKTENVVTSPVSVTYTPPQSTNSGSGPPRPEKSQLGVMNPNASATQIANANVTFALSVQDGLSDVTSLGLSEASLAPTQIRQTHPMLSNDQADFVNNLYINNVPASAIACVIERMIAGERQPAVDGFTSLPPPSYDRVASED